MPGSLVVVRIKLTEVVQQLGFVWIGFCAHPKSFLWPKVACRGGTDEVNRLKIAVEPIYGEESRLTKSENKYPKGVHGAQKRGQRLLMGRVKRLAVGGVDGA